MPQETPEHAPTRYHIPVMLSQCIEGLNINPEGTYVDITFGGGGHSREILKHLTTGRLLSFDQDPDARKQAEKLANYPQFTFIAANFRHLKRYLRLNKADKVDGILADLGVSSHQFDTAERGFSTRFDGELDMRMNASGELTAAQVINTYTESDLQQIFGKYGEVHNARTLANAIAAQRQAAPIQSIGQFKSLLEKYAPRHKEFKYFAQVFQALRIEVNEEIKVLEEFLLQVPEVLKPGGRLVVMSYHSLEDRPVKNFINKGKLEGEAEKDFFGNVLKPLKAINRKSIEADEAERETNPRSRSARLRIAELA